MLDYQWTESQLADLAPIWRLYHTNRIEITRTKWGEYRVWDVERADTVTIERTLDQAKKKAEAYHQIHC